VKGQQRDLPARDRPDNLFEPVPMDAGAHGPFDDRAHGRSMQLWATERRGWLAAAVAAVAAAGSALARR
jgi:hypothetical protein